MSNKIKFTAYSKMHYDIIPSPEPAASIMPLWWKDMPLYGSGDKLIINNGINNVSGKRCMPMRDAITSGYIIKLWSDVQVVSLSDSEYIPSLNWRSNIPIFEQNTDASKLIKTPNGYYPITFKFLNYWIINTPKGYSTSFYSPVGYENPFKVVPGIVETDKFKTKLPLPMWIKEGFEGVIEKDTPMVQFTPFKRDDWSSSTDYLEDGKHNVLEEKTIRSKLTGYYIKNIWSKKTYE